MSGADKPKKTWVVRLADAMALGVVFAIVYFTSRWGPAIPADEGDLIGTLLRSAGVIGAIGLLLLGGALMAELVEVLGVPHLTGYLFAGILAGPHVLHLIDRTSVSALAPVNTLAIALIALAGGAELRIDAIKQGFRGLAWAQFTQTLFGLLCCATVFALLRPSFTRGFDATQITGVALLWGVMAITRSPSAALGVLSQTRANGPLARFTLNFVMTSDVVVVVMLAIAITVATPLVDPAGSLSLGAFHSLGRELLGSVAMGTTLGLIVALYLRIVGKQLALVLLALGFGMTEVARYVHFEPLLTFIVAGFVVQNFSKQGDKFLHAIEHTGGVVYILFFATAGADLDLPLLRQLWPAALTLTLARAAITYGAARISSRAANDLPVVRDWGWAPLITQTGVALGVANAVAAEFPAFGKPFRELAIGCVALNQLVGPVLFKFALDRGKETKRPAPSFDEIDAKPA